VHAPKTGSKGVLPVHCAALASVLLLCCFCVALCCSVLSGNTQVSLPGTFASLTRIAASLQREKERARESAREREEEGGRGGDMRACLAVTLTSMLSCDTHVIYTSQQIQKCSSSSPPLGSHWHSTNLPQEAKMASDASSTLCTMLAVT